jgi:hypothetical protein
LTIAFIAGIPARPVPPLMRLCWVNKRIHDIGVAEEVD